MRTPRVVMTSGVFDLLHRGHLNVLWRSRQLGDLLVVGVVSDAGTAAYKGHFPAQPYDARAAAVRGLECVDLVLHQATTDPSDLLERIRPDVYTHGDDWKRLKVGHETIERLGIEWTLVPYTEGISSTLLRGVA
jgi:rfaE bifunctional protein nucleotidyltransferase chain/domain